MKCLALLAKTLFFLYCTEQPFNQGNFPSSWPQPAMLPLHTAALLLLQPALLPLNLHSGTTSSTREHSSYSTSSHLSTFLTSHTVSSTSLHFSSCQVVHTSSTSTSQSETGGGSYKYAAINYKHLPHVAITVNHHFQASLSETAISVWIVAADFFTTEQVCKILSTVRDRIKMEDWTAVCWSNKNVWSHQTAVHW